MKSGSQDNLFRTLVEHMNEAIWVGDQRERTVYANPKFCDMLGYSLDEMIGKESYEFWEAKSARRVREINVIHRKRGVSSSYEGSLETRRGDKIPVLLSGASLPDGGTIGIMTDLRELKRRDSREKIFAQVVKNSREAIVVMDKDRRVSMWNAGAEKTFGYKEKEMLGESIDKIVPNDQLDASRELLREVDKKVFITGVEVVRLQRTGRLVDVALSITRVADDGEFLGYLAIYSDISDKKKASVELQRRFETIQDAYKELGLQKRQIDYAHEIVDLAVSDASLSTLGNLIVSSLALLTKADGVVLRIISDDKKDLVLHACAGVGKNWWDKNKIPFKNSIAEEAFKKRRALIVDNVSVSPKYRGARLLRDYGFRTLISIPLFVGGDFLGSLNIYSLDPAKFRSVETDFLENFGKECAICLRTKLDQEKAAKAVKKSKKKSPKAKAKIKRKSS